MNNKIEEKIRKSAEICNVVYLNGSLSQGIETINVRVANQTVKQPGDFYVKASFRLDDRQTAFVRTKDFNDVSFQAVMMSRSECRLIDAKCLANLSGTILTIEATGTPRVFPEDGTPTALSVIHFFLIAVLSV